MLWSNKLLSVVLRGVAAEEGVAWAAFRVLRLSAGEPCVWIVLAGWVAPWNCVAGVVPTF